MRRQRNPEAPGEAGKKQAGMANEEVSIYHVPVMLRQAVDALDISPEGIYVDMTYGGGGHSREILRRLGPEGKLLAFDQDADAGQNRADDPRLTFVRSNFRFLTNFLRYYGISRVDGILADLGVSSHHLDEAQRGFSFRLEGPLDMRMNTCARLTAADVVNNYDEERLANVFYLYGELKNARKMAEALVKARAKKPVGTMPALAEALRPLLPRGREHKELAKACQALRIEVNGEMDALAKMLLSAIKALKPGGRLAVITYHSLEDRMVKNVVKTGNVAGKVATDFYGNLSVPLKAVGGSKPRVPDKEELERNPRSRSAKLRVAERVKTKEELDNGRGEEK